MAVSSQRCICNLLLAPRCLSLTSFWIPRQITFTVPAAKFLFPTLSLVHTDFLRIAPGTNTSLLLGWVAFFVCDSDLLSLLTRSEVPASQHVIDHADGLH